MHRSQAIDEPIPRAEGYTVPGLSSNSMLGLGPGCVSVPNCIQVNSQPLKCRCYESSTITQWW